MNVNIYIYIYALHSAADTLNRTECLDRYELLGSYNLHCNLHLYMKYHSSTVVLSVEVVSICGTLDLRCTMSNSVVALVRKKLDQEVL